ncbi:MAG: hypothetical protein QOH79_1405, partial [Acidimicrobiaceae bacterium]
GVDRSIVLLEAFNAYFLPQLDQLDEAATARLLSILDGALGPNERQAVRSLLDEFDVVATIA